jgi:hypothetical protein
MKQNQLMNRVIDYALCYLNSNWDEFVEDDLGISNEQFENLIKKFQKNLDFTDKNV